MRVKPPFFLMPFWLKCVFWTILSLSLSYLILSTQADSAKFYPFSSQISYTFYQWILLAFYLLILVLWMYWEVTSRVKHLNHQIQVTLQKKQVLYELKGPRANDIFGKLCHNLNSSMALMKTFDTMKSSRISLELNSLKLLMNYCSEGVMLINQNKIITHLNHQAEQLLGLVPDESVGELVSRYIAQETLLEAIGQALETGQKTTNLKLTLIHEHPTECHIFPIKNKYGQFIRVMLLLKGKSPETIENTKELPELS